MKYMELPEHNWHSINGRYDHNNYYCLHNPLPKNGALYMQILHKQPPGEPLSRFNNRNKMSLIPQEKEEGQTQGNTWVAFGSHREPSATRGPVAMTGVQERLGAESGISGGPRVIYEPQEGQLCWVRGWLKSQGRHGQVDTG